MAAQLAELFKRPEIETGIPVSVAKDVVNIFNDRFDEMFDPEHDHYFVAFALDPRYPIADILLIVETAEPSIIIPRPGIDYSMPHPRAFDRVKQFLKGLLRKLVQRAADIQKLPDKERKATYVPPVLLKLSEAAAALSLKNQLDAFWRGHWPFNAAFTGDDPLTWWRALRPIPQADILAMLAIRLLSAVPNSMPDERTGSTFTWLNSAVRGNQKAQTLVDMVQIRQWYMREDKRKVNREPPKRPTVKFRDIKADILSRVQSKSRISRNGGDEPAVLDEEDSDDEDNTAASTRGPHTPRVRSEDSDHVPASQLLRGTGINLESRTLRDLLSDKPLTDPRPTQTQPVVVVDVDAEPDWVF